MMTEQEKYLIPYRPDEVVEGLEFLPTPEPCWLCKKEAYHGFRHVMGEGYEDAVIPMCCEWCNLELVLG